MTPSGPFDWGPGARLLRPAWALVAAAAVTGAAAVLGGAGVGDRASGAAGAESAAAMGNAAAPAMTGVRDAAAPRFLAPPAGVDASLLQQAPLPTHEFSFTRAVYSDGGFGRRRWAAWATDFPKADRQFLYILDRMLTLLDVNRDENPVQLTDPNLRRYPFLYALEVGAMYLSPPEIEALRDYVHAGGFLVIDDFWGTREWANFEYQIRQVFPARAIEEITLDHPIFHSFYDIEEILQVPSIGNARYGQYWERDGYVPHVRGIFDDYGDLMVVINWNTDLGDAWEWSESPDYPFDRSSFAYQMAINFIIYAMTH